MYKLTEIKRVDGTPSWNLYRYRDGNRYYIASFNNIDTAQTIKEGLEKQVNLIWNT